MYYLSTEDFNSFKQSFQQENRGMIEQELNLTCNEKQKMFTLLQQNLMNENKFYKYDFLFDNCTTRLRDLLERSADTPVHFSPVINKPSTFRQFIFEYMDYNDEQWVKLGMDVILGNTTDAIMTNKQVMFLPDYLLRGFDKGRIGNKQIVSSKQKIIDIPEERKTGNFFTHPFFIFTLLFLLIVVLTFSKNNFVQRFLYGFDGLMFFMAGLTGCLLVFMWLGTDHIVCKNNYNLLWAWPTHTVAAFFIHSKKQWVKNYFKINAIINIILLIAWFFLPQHMSPSLIPIILILIFRGYRKK